MKQTSPAVTNGDHVAALGLLEGAEEGAQDGPAARGGTLRRWIDGIAGAFRQPGAWAHTVWADTEWASTLVLPSEVRGDARTDVSTNADPSAPH